MVAAGGAVVQLAAVSRTVGLVTLPGAFVGVLLAGASPWQAGAAPVLVLISLVRAAAVRSPRGLDHHQDAHRGGTAVDDLAITR